MKGNALFGLTKKRHVTDVEGNQFSQKDFGFRIGDFGFAVILLIDNTYTFTST